jgi:hypothetical protein
MPLSDAPRSVDAQQQMILSNRQNVATPFQNRAPFLAARHRLAVDGAGPRAQRGECIALPRVNETVVNLSFDDARSGSTGGFGLTLGGNLPRRFASSTDAVSELRTRYA